MTSLEIPFKNLMNESYSKDSSKKMRTALNFKIFKTFYNWLFYKIISHLYIQMEM